MGTSPSRVAVALAFAVSIALAACASKSKARLDTLGDCVPAMDASCSVASYGGNTTAPANDGGADSGDDGGGTTVGTGGSCGTTGALFGTSNPACPLCVNTRCCQIAATCSASPGCLQLIQCAQTTCQRAGGACLQSCENLYPNDVGTYLDFASCMLPNCSPACPTLPQSTVGDF